MYAGFGTVGARRQLSRAGGRPLPRPEKCSGMSIRVCLERRVCDQTLDEPISRGESSRYEQRLPVVEDRIRVRLSELSARLGNADWLDGGFSAGDLTMVAVLLRLKASGMLDEYPRLSAYVARGEARAAYQRAFDAQLAVFTGQSPAG